MKFQSKQFASISAGVFAALSWSAYGLAGPFAEQVKKLDDPTTVDALVKAGEPALADLSGELTGPRADLAVQAIGQMKLPQATPNLLPLTTSPNGELRAAVAWALGECGGGQAVEALTKLASDPYPRVRVSAVLALAKLKAPGLNGVLSTAINDPEASVRLAAANAVKIAGDKTLFIILTPLLKYHVEIVPDKDDKSPTPKMVEQIVWTEADSQVRLAAIQALGQIKVADALPPLIDSMEREEPFNRLVIIQTIESMGPSAAPVCLGRIVPLPYEKETFDKRMPLLINNGTLAVIAGRLGNARCVPDLLNTLKLPREKLGADKDLTELYIESVRLLGVFKVDKAAPDLAALLKQPRVQQLADALQTSLRQIGRPAARPLASNLDDWQTAPTFLALLREPDMYTAAAREQIVNYLTHESDEVRMAATQTLGLYLYEGILDEYDVPLLDAMYMDPNRDVRVECARWQEKIVQKYGAEVKQQ